MPDVLSDQYDQHDTTAANMERMRRRARPVEQRTRHERAFVVEALFLLVFMMGSLAVLTGLMVSSYERGAAADDLSYAVALASNDAEAFAADPAGQSRGATGAGLGASAGIAEGFQLTRDVEQHAQEAGVLYEAHITVSRDGHAIYALDTARYVSDAAVAARASGATQAVSFSSFSVADEFSTLTGTASLAGGALAADEAAHDAGRTASPADAAALAAGGAREREEVEL
ncbi:MULTISPECIES: hypothetical protein [unclassified Adlercreutzia]|uniref:hypothetical protein n=1 Tax=unclassified Adlercreutzia TaxID=2636013 RepID=UPI0013EAE11F|nr:MULTISPECIES: hypothetical protein [unclassified Adlercreutzia]